mmetsp:Transcript_101999/g.233607  ORF Transcript_101999/g.233607 Transcript_101999/m.233607 type:complete len:114 (-) Transcript_101999:27-368(-)
MLCAGKDLTSNWGGMRSAHRENFRMVLELAYVLLELARFLWAVAVAQQCGLLRRDLPEVDRPTTVTSRHKFKWDEGAVQLRFSSRRRVKKTLQHVSSGGKPLLVKDVLPVPMR